MQAPTTSENASKFVCVNCDYTETGSPETCPECGVTVSQGSH